MKQYRVHLFREMRLTFEVQADNPDEAYDIADNTSWKMADEIEDCEAMTTYAIIDPLLENGEVDYDNVISRDPTKLLEATNETHN